MTQTPHDNLDSLLHEHLTSALDPHRGRAAAAFLTHVKQQRVGALQAAIAAQKPSYLFPRIVAYGVPSLLAASLALIAAIYFTQVPKIIVPPASGTAVNAPTESDQVVLTRNLDAGIATLEGEPGGPTPVRLVRQQTLRHAQWVDPEDNATYSITQPVEKVGYVRIQPY